MKRWIAGLVSLLLAVSVGSIAASAAEPYSFENTKLANDEAIFIIQEPGYEAAQHSSLTVQPGPGAQGDGRVWYHCASLTDKKCVEKNLVPDLAWMILPSCDSSASSACVQSLEMSQSGQEMKPAKYLRTATGGIRIEADPSHNLLEGVTPSLYESADVKNAGDSTNYAVTIRVSQHLNPKTKAYEFGDVIANVIPYKEISGNFRASYINTAETAENQYWTDGRSSGCVWVEDGKCGVRQDFAAGTKVRLKFKIPNKIGGWFSGRMKSPSISVTAAGNGYNLISVESESVQVPQFAYVQKKSAITDTVRNYNIGRGGSANGEFWAVTAGGPGGEDTFKYIDNFRANVKDTVAGYLTYWSMRTVGAANNGGNSCLSDTSKVLGIVTTDSMAYDTGTPAYVKGFLNYKVAGLHYSPDGITPVEGVYDLVMRSEVARCAYGFTSAPVSATVTVVGASGENKTATTLVSEKNGWLKLAAYGFTFSSPTISVKLSQAKAVKTTITCTKGKLIKNVTGVGPKCPAGFKKK